MAIETYTFSFQTSTREAIQAWFEEHATDYFDSFETLSDESAFGFTCKCGELDFLTFKYLTPTNNTVEITINTLGGVSKTEKANSSGGKYAITKIVKTDYAIAFSISSGGNNNGHLAWVITKSDKGNTVLIWPSGNPIVFSSTTLTASVVSEKRNVDDTIVGVARVYSTDSKVKLTSKVPLICDGDCEEYTPDVFNLVQSPYLGIEGILNIDGQQYVSTKYLLLRA